ncbi:MAG: hypothetical protein R3224_10765 [Balneolaceae bacterium]|nr:hypothetical protein [Balneolaceae bacterium]
MDFTTFDQDPQQSSPKSYHTTQEYEHFLTAVGSASILRFIFAVNLAIPRTILGGASHIEPELNSDGEWEWTYSQSTQESSFEVRLVAIVSGGGEQINWEFYVTSEQHGMDNFLFFEGTTNSDASNGTWTSYDPSTPEQQSAVSQVDWNVVNEEDKQLSLEVLTDRNEHLGDTIDYTFDGTLKTAVFTDASEGTTVTLEWYPETHEGSITAPGYNNGEKACWDSELKNTACS